MGDDPPAGGGGGEEVTDAEMAAILDAGSDGASGRDAPASPDDEIVAGAGGGGAADDLVTDAEMSELLGDDTAPIIGDEGGSGGGSAELSVREQLEVAVQLAKRSPLSSVAQLGTATEEWMKSDGGMAAGDDVLQQVMDELQNDMKRAETEGEEALLAEEAELGAEDASKDKPADSTVPAPPTEAAPAPPKEPAPPAPAPPASDSPPAAEGDGEEASAPRAPPAPRRPRPPRRRPPPRAAEAEESEAGDDVPLPSTPPARASRAARPATPPAVDEAASEVVAPPTAPRAPRAPRRGGRRPRDVSFDAVEEDGGAGEAAAPPARAAIEEDGEREGSDGGVEAESEEKGDEEDGRTAADRASSERVVASLQRRRRQRRAMKELDSEVSERERRARQQRLRQNQMEYALLKNLSADMLQPWLRYRDDKAARTIQRAWRGFARQPRTPSKRRGGKRSPGWRRAGLRIDTGESEGVIAEADPFEELLYDEIDDDDEARRAVAYGDGDSEYDRFDDDAGDDADDAYDDDAGRAGGGRGGRQPAIARVSGAAVLRLSELSAAIKIKAGARLKAEHRKEVEAGIVPPGRKLDARIRYKRMLDVKATAAAMMHDRIASAAERRHAAARRRGLVASMDRYYDRLMYPQQLDALAAERVKLPLSELRLNTARERHDMRVAHLKDAGRWWHVSAGAKDADLRALQHEWAFMDWLQSTPDEFDGTHDIPAGSVVTGEAKVSDEEASRWWLVYTRGKPPRRRPPPGRGFAARVAQEARRLRLDIADEDARRAAATAKMENGAARSIQRAWYHHRRRQSARRAREARARLCDECGEVDAIYSCNECVDSSKFCADCWTHVHRTKKRRKHRAQPIEEETALPPTPPPMRRGQAAMEEGRESDDAGVAGLPDETVDAIRRIIMESSEALRRSLTAGGGVGGGAASSSFSSRRERRSASGSPVRDLSVALPSSLSVVEEESVISSRSSVPSPARLRRTGSSRREHRSPATTRASPPRSTSPWSSRRAATSRATSAAGSIGRFSFDSTHALSSSPTGRMEGAADVVKAAERTGELPERGSRLSRQTSTRSSRRQSFSVMDSLDSVYDALAASHRSGLSLTIGDDSAASPRLNKRYASHDSAALGDEIGEGEEEWKDAELEEDEEDSDGELAAGDTADASAAAAADAAAAVEEDGGSLPTPVFREGDEEAYFAAIRARASGSRGRVGGASTGSVGVRVVEAPPEDDVRASRGSSRTGRRRRGRGTARSRRGRSGRAGR